MPSDSLSAARSFHARADLHDYCLSSSARSERRSHGSGSSTSRLGSASSAFDFRPSSTPDSYLHLPAPPPNSTRGRPSIQRIKPMPPLPPKRPLDSRRASSCVPSWKSGRSSLDDTATCRGKNFRRARETADGKVCLHTHHHHYWIMSEPARMQQVIPKLRSSKKRAELQQTDENSRFDSTMSSWPSEGRVEALAEAGRPPSRNTNQRYLVKG